jgi:transketolase
VSTDQLAAGEGVAGPAALGAIGGIEALSTIGAIDDAAGPAAETRTRAAAIRRHIVDMCANPEGGHLGGSLSCADILSVLYFSVLRVDPDRPGDPDRDVFVLSKGHAAIALYATLAERGFLPTAELATYAGPGGRLMGHPVRAVPGVEMPTGSLGHGLPLGLGFALSGRLAGRSRRAFVLLGDGELQEGSNWEAASVASAHRADSLVAIVDRNRFQLGGGTEEIGGLEPLGDRWRAFGWAVREVDGHDHDALRSALSSAPWQPGRPSVLIARTVKGQGVPMMAGRVSSHYATLNPRLHGKVLRSLESAAGERP